MSELGTLTKVEEKQFAEFVDNVFDFKKIEAKGWAKIALTLAEKYDDNIFFALISYIDDKFGEKLKPAFKIVVHDFVIDVISKNTENMKKSATNLINVLVDIPKIPEETEAIIIASLVNGIVDAIVIKFTKN